MINFETNLKNIETQLDVAISHVTLIGELDISRKEFGKLARALQTARTPDQIGKCTLVTSMVFSARYAEFTDEEHIHFWDKYLHNVWQKEHDTEFINDCRKLFREARTYLRQQLNLDFPDKAQSAQDVVSGIYLHSILPAYLQDDFVDFFLKALPNLTDWERVVGQSTEQVIKSLEDMTLPPNTRKRLTTFLKSAVTIPTAARLVQTMATASQWYIEGEDITHITNALVSVVERTIWDQLFPKLHRKPKKGRTHSQQEDTRVRWAWLYEENDILEIHLNNVPLKTENPPDSVVWLPLKYQDQIQVGMQVPEYGTHRCEVNAWRTELGFYIDTATLIDIEQAGVVVAVSREDEALSAAIPVRPLPNDSIAFFQIQNDSRLGILTGIDALTDGSYAISYKSSVQVAEGTEKTALNPIQQLLVPKAFRAMGHDHAALFEIKLPIWINDLRIDQNRVRLPPVLDGTHRVPGLQPGAMPVFENGDLWLLLSPPTGVSRDRLSLRITVNEEQVLIFRLGDPDVKKAISHDETDRFRIRLNDFIPEFCLVQVEVFNGLTLINKERLVAGLLPPKVQIRPSDPNDYFTKEKPAFVRISGVQEEDIELASDAKISAGKEDILIQWVDPRQDTAFRIRRKKVSIPITLETRWSFAWVEPIRGSILSEESLDDALVHVRGKPGQKFWIRVEEQPPRQYQLKSRGFFDARIKDDPLYDLLRNYSGSKVPIFIRFDNHREETLLFTFIRPTFRELEKRTALVKSAVTAFRESLRASRRSEGTVAKSLLSLLPWTDFESYSQRDLPSPLKELHDAHKVDKNIFEGSLFPKPKTQLIVSNTVAYDLSVRSEGGFTLEIQRKTNASKVPATVILYQEGSTLNVQTKNIWQCNRCGELYWATDNATKQKHLHGQVLFDVQSLDSNSLRGTIELTTLKDHELKEFKPNFAGYIDVDAQRSFRIFDPGHKHARSLTRSNNLFTKDYYRYVTAQWILRKDFGEHLLGLLRQSKTFVDETLKKISRSTSRELLLAGRWVTEQLAQRDIGNDLWRLLDPAVMTLAIVARAYASNIGNVVETHDEEKVFKQLLHDFHVYCPELLAWALSWAEVFFLP